MVQRKGGFRRKTRNKLKKHPRTSGKISIRRSLQLFEEGEHVTLSAEPAVQTGMYHPRYHGKSGIIIGKQGNCYKVNVKDRTLVKELIVDPVHLIKQ